LCIVLRTLVTVGNPQSYDFIDGLAGTSERTVDKLGMVIYKPTAAGATPTTRLRELIEFESKRLPQVSVFQTMIAVAHVFNMWLRIALCV
jgi:hypothetical protein